MQLLSIVNTPMIYCSENRCVGCGLCVDVCPAKAIRLGEDKGVALIDRQKCTRCLACASACPQDAIKDIEGSFLFAIGTDDGKTIKQDDHFGMSGSFQIWRYADGAITFQEKRENSKYEEDKTRIHGDPQKASATASVLKDVDVLVGKLMGPNIVRLQAKFVPVIVRAPAIADAIRILHKNIVEIADEKAKSARKGLVLQ